MKKKEEKIENKGKKIKNQKLAKAWHKVKVVQKIKEFTFHFQYPPQCLILLYLSFCLFLFMEMST
jgi:hypothetical protein